MLYLRVCTSYFPRICSLVLRGKLQLSVVVKWRGIHPSIIISWEWSSYFFFVFPFVTASVGAKLLNAALLFIGLFLISLGHRFYKCQLFLLGFCMSAILFYVLLERVISVGSTGTFHLNMYPATTGNSLLCIIWNKDTYFVNFLK